MNDDKAQVPPTNRGRLITAKIEISRVIADMCVSPSVVSYLNVAIAALEDASNWPLDENERAESMRELQA
jgi:hypothetical protein